jgi:hypothetical protein
MLNSTLNQILTFSRRRVKDTIQTIAARSSLKSPIRQPQFALLCERFEMCSRVTFEF